MEEKLQQVIDNIESSKFEETIRLESINENSSILKTKLKAPIQLNPNRHYKAGLRYFTVYNNIVNVESTNNVFRYFSARELGRQLLLQQVHMRLHK